MCDVVERIREKANEELIIKILESKKITVEQIADMLQVPVETIKEIAQKVPVLK